MPLLFSWVSYPRPGIPHASRAMQEKGSGEATQKTAINVERSIQCAHETPNMTRKRRENKSLRGEIG